ncbi:MAG: hypothetical protein K2X48_07090 [Chitinophagaceae bacterium]|nr:hypothetical protein [Chitinophagaceae bacterium]
MHENTLNIIYKWLKQANYNISLTDLQKQFLSHPDVGALSSITDTLNDFNIPNQAAQINTASLNQLTEPFIAFIKSRQVEQFVLVSPIGNKTFKIYNGKDEPFTLSFNEVTALSTGIIVAIDKQQKQSNKKGHVLISLILIIAVVSIIVLLLIQSSEITAAFFHLLTLAGAAFSVLLYAHGPGLKSNLFNRFCTISKHSSCNDVLQSDAARISKYVSLTDVGVVYFSFQLLSLLFSNNENTLLYAISIVAAAFSFYSVYQQAFIIKKWCPLCLGIVGVLMLQGIIAVFTINPTAIVTTEIISLFFLFSLTCTGWYYCKGIFTKGRKLVQTETDLLSFKRNYHLFLPFYKSENPVDDTALSNQQQIIIGNKNAPVCMTLITNPLCEACQKAHKLLNELRNQSRNDISLRIVFYVPYQNLNDPRTMIAGWLTETYLKNNDKGIEAIEKWYTHPDTNKFDKLKLPKEVIEKQQSYLQNHAEWCIEQRLILTPLLLINNKLFPLIYRTEDLQYHIENIIHFEKEMSCKNDKSFHSTMVLASNT